MQSDDLLVYLDDFIGKGTFAQVYKGTHSSNKAQTLAVKIVSKENLRKWGEKGEKNLRNELKILSKIKHKNIVRFIEFI